MPQDGTLVVTLSDLFLRVQKVWFWTIISRDSIIELVVVLLMPQDDTLVVRILVHVLSDDFGYVMIVLAKELWIKVVIIPPIIGE